MKLLEFWNTHDVTSVFVVSAACPMGEEFFYNDSDGEDYCDLDELINTGLFACPIDGSTPWWDLEGDVTEGTWEWDGDGTICDVMGNNYRRISVNSCGERAQ